MLRRSRVAGSTSCSSSLRKQRLPVRGTMSVSPSSSDKRNAPPSSSRQSVEIGDEGDHARIVVAETIAVTRIACARRIRGVMRFDFVRAEEQPAVEFDAQCVERGEECARRRDRRAHRRATASHRRGSSACWPSEAPRPTAAEARAPAACSRSRSSRSACAVGASGKSGSRHAPRVRRASAMAATSCTAASGIMPL